MHKVKHYFSAARTNAHNLLQHAVFRHSHHIAYYIYYGIAVTTESGIFLIVSSSLLAAAVLAALAGEDI